MTHKRDPKPPSDWTLDHPWLYVYSVITGLLLTLLTTTYLTDLLKGTLP